MNIQADKFLALTAMLAGFVPAAGCSIKIDGSASSETNSNSDSNSNSGATDTTGGTGGTTQDDPTGTTGSASATGSGTSSGTTDEPTTDVPTTGATTTVGTATTTTEGSSTGGADNDCCEAKQTAGCSDMTIQDCVCAEDPICCGADGGSWDSICVGEVNVLGCGMCEIADTTGEGGSSSGGSTGP